MRSAKLFANMRADVGLLVCWSSKGRHRTVMSSGHYTELFFLDEAVAFAAGHRPCAECRRDRFNAFQEVWKRAGYSSSSADEIDRVLHEHRLDARKQKVTYESPLNLLPDGCFVDDHGHCYLVWNGALQLWSPQGYVSKRDWPIHSILTVLTPKPIVDCFRYGYRPEIHVSSTGTNN